MSSTALRELDQRVSDGIEVRLLWHPAEDRVIVDVSDAKTGEAFTLAVEAGERAYDVFHHPYAYAAAREARQRPFGDLTVAG